MDPRHPPPQSIDLFKSQVDSISGSVSALLKTLADVGNHEPTQGLSDELEAFHYSLVVLSYHILEGNQRYQDWCDTTRLVALLRSAEQCFHRFYTLLVNSTRSEFYSIKKYFSNSGSEGEMKHLRLRLKIYTTALSNPILLSAVHNTHLVFGNKFRSLAFKAINDWIHQLTQESITLAHDHNVARTQDGPSNRMSTSLSRAATGNLEQSVSDSRSDLLTEKEELIKILQIMIGTAMKMVKRGQRDILTQQREREAVEMSGPASPNLSMSISTTVTSLERDPDRNETITFQQLSLARTETTRRAPEHQTPQYTHEQDLPRALQIQQPNASSSQAVPTTINSSDAPPSYSNIATTPSNNTNLDNPPDLPTQLCHLYTTALNHLQTGNPLAALSTLEDALILLPTMPTPTPPSHPTPADIHLLLARTCLSPSLKRITRARHLLKSLYTAPTVSPPARRFDAAHLLAQLYMYVDGNPNDPTVDWDGISMNLEKAAEYVVAAVRGRRALLGLGHEDTQRSVELLATLCERAGSGGGDVVGGLLEVLGEVFEEREGEERGRVGGVSVGGGWESVERA